MILKRERKRVRRCGECAYFESFRCLKHLISVHPAAEACRYFEPKMGAR